MAFEATDLSDGIKALEEALSEAPKKKEEQTLEKALADVASSALDIAKSATGKKSRRLVKAQAEEPEDEDEPEEESDDAEPSDDDSDDAEAFVQQLMKQYAMQKAQKQPKTSGKHRPLRKALDATHRTTPTQEDAVDVSHYLEADLELREKDSAAIAALQKALQKLTDKVDEHAKQTQYVQGLLAKGLNKLLTEPPMTFPPDSPQSKFDSMAKAVRAQGGREVPYSEELAAKLGVTGKMNTEQMSVWKHTGILPAGININVD